MIWSACGSRCSDGRRRPMGEASMTTRRQFMGACAGMVAGGCAGSGAREAPTSAAGTLGRDGGAGKLLPVRQVMEAEMAQGRLSGAVWLVAQGKEVIVDTVGVTA